MMTREANYHSHLTPPASSSLLLDAFARRAAYVAHPTFVGDLRAFVKRKSGKLRPYNHVALRCVPQQEP
jgi:hypothetical protein